MDALCWLGTAQACARSPPRPGVERDAQRTLRQGTGFSEVIAGLESELKAAREAARRLGDDNRGCYAQARPPKPTWHAAIGILACPLLMLFMHVTARRACSSVPAARRAQPSRAAALSPAQIRAKDKELDAAAAQVAEARRIAVENGVRAEQPARDCGMCAEPGRRFDHCRFMPRPFDGEKN